MSRPKTTSPVNSSHLVDLHAIHVINRTSSSIPDYIKEGAYSDAHAEVLRKQIEVAEAQLLLSMENVLSKYEQVQDLAIAERTKRENTTYTLQDLINTANNG